MHSPRPLSIPIILGTPRQGRLSEHVARVMIEQASARGHLQDTSFGPLSFPDTIHNQFLTSLSTLRAAQDLRERLLDYQAGFYHTAAEEAGRSSVRAYVFGSPDPVLSALFAGTLRQHRIEVYELAGSVTHEGRSFLSWKLGETAAQNAFASQTKLSPSPAAAKAAAMASLAFCRSALRRGRFRSPVAPDGAPVSSTVNPALRRMSGFARSPSRRARRHCA